MNKEAVSEVRIDKWLWAARLYKTRSLAKQAVEGGKVHVEGVRVKPSKEIHLAMRITLSQGYAQKDIIVTGLSDQRRGAPEASLLYSETPESIANREQRALEHKAHGLGFSYSDGKPNKKQRRQIHRFKNINAEIDD
jgi:ribosome-associated heat shock protein Hsp15